MGLTDYFTYAVPVVVLELLAALAGMYYLRKVPAASVWSRRVVYFLFVVFLIECIATYAVIGYYSEYRYFAFVKDTIFESNRWLYNIYSLINFPFFMLYFASFLRNKIMKAILTYGAALYFLYAILVFAISGVFFTSKSPYVNFTGTFLLLLSIIFYYFEVLRSDYILKLKRLLPFYISAGVLVFNLVVTPLSIFTKYFSSSSGNDLFVKLHVYIILLSNIFMYSCFIIGFILCSKKKKFSY